MKTFLPPLTQPEEKEYIARMKSGSQEAKHVLVERNMRLVAHIVKKYQNVDEETEELISIGTIGLIKAVGTYNDTRGSRLATYAARCIDNAILSQMRLWWRTNLPRAEKNPFTRLLKPDLGTRRCPGFKEFAHLLSLWMRI